MMKRSSVFVAMLLLPYSCKTINKANSALHDTSTSTDTSKYRCWQESGQTNDTRETLLLVYTAFAKDFIRQQKAEPANCDALNNHIATGQDIFIDLSGLGLRDEPIKSAFIYITNIMKTNTIAGIDISDNLLMTYNPFYIKGVSGNIVYMNMANNKYAADLNTFLQPTIDISKLAYFNIEGNSFNGNISFNGAEEGRMANLIYFNARGNRLDKFEIDNVWPSIKILELSDQTSKNFQLSIYDPNLQLDLVHLGLRGGKIFEAAKLNTKFVDIGSADFSKVVLSQEASLKFVGSFLDIRSSSIIVNLDTKYNYIWRDNCAGVTSCAQDGVMQIGGCKVPSLFNALAGSVTVGETVNGYTVEAKDIDLIKIIGKDYATFCI